MFNYYEIGDQRSSGGADSGISPALEEAMQTMMQESASKVRQHSAKDEQYVEITPLEHQKNSSEISVHPSIGEGWQSQETVERYSELVGMEINLVSKLENAFLNGDFKALAEYISKYGPGSPEATGETAAMQVAFSRAWDVFSKELNDLGFSANLDDSGRLEISNQGRVGRTNSIVIDTQANTADISLRHEDGSIETVKCDIASQKVKAHYAYDQDGDYVPLAEMTLADAGKLLVDDIQPRQQAALQQRREDRERERRLREEQQNFQQQEKEREEIMRRAREEQTP